MPAVVRSRDMSGSRLPRKVPIVDQAPNAARRPKEATKKGRTASPNKLKDEVKQLSSWETFRKNYIYIQEGDGCVIKICKVFALIIALAAFPLTLALRATLYFYDSCFAERIDSTGSTKHDRGSVKA